VQNYVVSVARNWMMSDVIMMSTHHGDDDQPHPNLTSDYVITLQLTSEDDRILG